VVVDLVLDIERRMIHTNEKIYVHCRGGHGRTGVIVAILIGKIGKLDAYEALEVAQKCHDHRQHSIDKPGFTCPQTSVQRNQVYRILGKLNG